MSKRTRRRNRRARRQLRQRAKHRKPAPRHNNPNGRTGSIASSRRKEKSK